MFLPFLQKTLRELESLRGGVGTKMLKFANEFERTGTYTGQAINRARHSPRSKIQARIDEYAHKQEAENPENEKTMAESLFRSFDFYITYVKESLETRFGPLSKEPLVWFSIFDPKNWPKREQNKMNTAFNMYGVEELRKLVHHFREVLEEDEQIAAQTEWIHYKYAAIDKLNEDVATAITLQQCESQKSSVETDEPHIPQVTNSSLFDLCMHLIRKKDGIGISNVCLLVIIMVCLSPSNAHVERMVKALNHIAGVIK